WWRAGERITQASHRASPVGDTARRISLQRGLEPRDRLAEREGMEQGHRAGELLLRGRAAGCGEVDGAELLESLLGLGREDEQKTHQNGDRRTSHGLSPCLVREWAVLIVNCCEAHDMPVPMRGSWSRFAWRCPRFDASGMPDALPDLIIPAA